MHLHVHVYVKPLQGWKGREGSNPQEFVLVKVLQGSDFDMSNSPLGGKSEEKSTGEEICHSDVQGSVRNVILASLKM